MVEQLISAAASTYQWSEEVGIYFSLKQTNLPLSSISILYS